MNNAVSRLVLGTAQLGMLYGIANRTGKPDFQTAKKMIEIAWQSGVRFFDTAQAYGDAEKVLGVCFENLAIRDQAKVILKIHPGLENASYQVIADEIKASIKKLGVPKLYAALLHRGEWLKNWRQKYEPALGLLKHEGLVDHFGVSIYEEEEVEMAFGIDALTIIQLPFNLFDQRALKQNWFERAEQLSKEVHVRSIYLQGLLLMDPESLSRAMQFTQRDLTRFVRFCSEHGKSQKEVAFRFAWRRSRNAKVVIGAERPEQISDNLEMVKNSTDEQIDFEEVLDRRINNPSLWN